MKGKIPPFILIQPDGSLPLSNKYRIKLKNGLIYPKGSFYVNSPTTGNYRDYIFKDLILHVENKYHVLKNKKNRHLIGGSMGGYGGIIGGFYYHELFDSIVALSPVVNPSSLKKINLINPMDKKILGEKQAIDIGRKELEDILESCHLIFSENLDKGIEELNWERYNLLNFINSNPDIFNDLNLSIFCEKTDEYLIVEDIRKFSTQLSQQKIPHTVRIFVDKKSQVISPHMAGIRLKIFEAIKRCFETDMTFK